MADVPPGMPVIAIGGITPDNAGAVWAVGVQGLAVIHAVVGAQDPGRAVAALLEGRGVRG
jgi:thiamine-phosphate pyrophosphorylase